MKAGARNERKQKKFLDKLNALLKEYEIEEMSAEYIANSTGIPYDAKIVFYSNGNELSFMRHINGQFEQLETHDAVYRPEEAEE